MTTRTEELNRQDEFIQDQDSRFNESVKQTVKAVLLTQHSFSGSVKWFAAIAGDYTIIAFAFFIMAKIGWPAYPVSLLLLGIAQHRIAILGHDGAHGMVVRNKKINYWIAQILCFWPLLTDIKSYRKFHWDHHRNTGDELNDPELKLKEDRYHLPKTKMQLFHRFVLDMLGWSIKEFVKVSAFMSRNGNPLWAGSFLVIGCTASVYYHHPEFFILFMLAKPTSFWAVFRLRIYTEHVGVPDTHRVQLNIWQRWLFSPHNSWMHWEHHKHPQVPFWQLPAVRSMYPDVPVISFNELLRSGQVQSPAKHPWSKDFETREMAASF